VAFNEIRLYANVKCHIYIGTLKCKIVLVVLKLVNFVFYVGVDTQLLRIYMKYIKIPTVMCIIFYFKV